MVDGCKQSILDIFLTLLFTWKHEKKSLSNLEPSFSILKQMKHLVFFMGISSLPLAFQSKLCHIIWTWKNTQKKTQQLHHSLGVGDDFNFEKKLN
jgi:hypothetical protein